MTASKTLSIEIQKAFASVGQKKIDDDIVSKCVAIASTSRLSPEDIAGCWEAFSLSKPGIATLNESCYSAFRDFLRKEADKIGGILEENGSPAGTVFSQPTSNKRQDLPSVTPPAKRFHSQDGAASTTTPSIVDRLHGNHQGSNRRVSLSPGPPVSATPSNSSKYSERQGVGKVVASYNPNNLEKPPALDPNPSGPRCVVSLNEFESNVKKPYRHMFTTLEERAKALDGILEELGHVMVERYNLGVEEEQNGVVSDVAPLEAVGVPRQDKICCIGRICNMAHTGHINDTSLLLEGSRNTAGGQRVELDISGLKSGKTPFSLFPGQIVAVEGMNTSGRTMVASRICEGAAPEAPKTPVKDLLHFHHDDECQGGKPLSIVAVSGPFSTRDSLDYQPLTDLIDKLLTDQPDVVIMTGPFVDIGHNSVQSGQTTLRDEETGVEVVVPYDTFFMHKFASMLESFYGEKKSNTQFVLVPSLDDATSKWVYPQPPISDRIQNPDGSSGVELDFPGAEGLAIGSLGLDDRRIICAPNPCTLRINDIVVGVTSTDVLFHVAGDETNANLPPGTRLERLSQHMIQQQSYYPLFPPGPNVNLNMKYSQHWRLPCKPDILVIPSKLASFAKPILESTIVVNPGRLTRDTTGGTFASIDVFPFERETLENAGGDNVELLHSVHQRTRVEITKI